TIHAFANVNTLITNGVVALSDIANGERIEDRERLEFQLFEQLLVLLPDIKMALEEGTLDSQHILQIGNSVQTGAASARGDDIKTLKVAVLNWLTPDRSEGLVPHIPRDQMTCRGFNHEATGKPLCPAGLDYEIVKDNLRNLRMIVAGDQWPIFLYCNYNYNPDAPWDGLLQGRLLVNGMRHVFCSPSSVTQERKATKAGNARLHGMTKVTPASLCYVAMLVRFALSSATSFNRADVQTDSEMFYRTLYDFVVDPAEQENFNWLLMWWNRTLFPHAVTSMRAPTENSALARLLQARASRSAESNP
ncbi:hypothetical protein C8Q80DRAFT_1095221, partial [Daedaleopsis nitida]